jgi:hypothetical protein
LSPNTLAKLDQEYRERFTHRISFNDASLQFGGLLDNKTFEDDNGTVTGGGRDNLCHDSHHRGVDIDVNREDEQFVDMSDVKFDVNGVDKPIEFFIKSRATNYGLSDTTTDGYMHLRLKSN